MEKLETVFLWCIGVVEKAKEIYLRWFPTAGGIFAVVFPWWLASMYDKGELTAADVPYIMMTVMSFTILCLIYIIILIKNRKED